MKLSVLHGFGLFLVLSLFAATALADAGEKKHRHWKNKFGPQRQIVQEFCQNNPEDSRCVEIQQKQEQRREKFKACSTNPAAEGCERFQQRMERKKQKCAENPESPFCKNFQ